MVNEEKDCYYMVEFEGEVNASDLDGDDLTFELLEDAQRGDLELDTETGSYTYTPVNGYGVTDSFEFRAFDGEDYSQTGVVTFNIINPDLPDCGNEECDIGETCENCSQDCICICGDGECNGVETCLSCAADCGTCEDEDDEDEDSGGSTGGTSTSRIRQIVQEEIKETLMDILVSQTGESEEEITSKGITTLVTHTILLQAYTLM